MDCPHRMPLYQITLSKHTAYRGLGQDAEVASLDNTPDAFKLYDVAVKYAQRPELSVDCLFSRRLSVNNDWLMEEGYSLYLVCRISLAYGFC